MVSLDQIDNREEELIANQRPWVNGSKSEFPVIYLRTQ